MGKKSHKKDPKKKSKKPKKHRSSSSSSSTSNDDQWVEDVKNLKSLQSEQSFIKSKEETDNWMNFVCKTSTVVNKKVNPKNKDLDDAKAQMEKPGQSARELNPYWKNGGTGLPPPKSLSHHKGFLKPKIDDDDVYRHNKHHYTNTASGRQSWKKYDQKDNKHNSKKDVEKQDQEEKYKQTRGYNESKEERSKRHKEYDKREQRHKYDNNRKEEKDKSHRDYENKGNKDRSNREHYHKRESVNKHEESKEYKTINEKYDEEAEHNQVLNSSNIKDHEECYEKPLTDSELNTLAAKQIKAELMGNTKLAEELKKKLDSARIIASEQNNVQSKTKRTEEEFVLLTRTSSKGYSYPVKQSQSDKNDGKKRRREKVLTHEDGKRVRYFDDDDKYSLKSMFEKEMTSTASDSNMEFVKLSRKVNSRDDEDDVFVDRASEKLSTKASEREVKRAINEHKRTEKILNSCRYCFDSNEMLKHLFIAKGEKCYLCLPSYKSLTEGHCLIAPIYHYGCATDIDEDVWMEMQIFRKVLTSMFKDQDEDVVFFESAMHLHNMPHMVWNCVPVPIEIGDTAPIYFKKAILECETEWAINTKVVDLSSKDVRRAVPKGLPYFAVDFGMQGGYAHVIEDEKIFPNNFAEEIIGGMMDLDHNAWRKKLKEPIEDQLQKATKFLEMWKNYDFTKK